MLTKLNFSVLIFTRYLLEQQTTARKKRRLDGGTTQREKRTQSFDISDKFPSAQRRSEPSSEEQNKPINSVGFSSPSLSLSGARDDDNPIRAILDHILHIPRST